MVGTYLIDNIKNLIWVYRILLMYIILIKTNRFIIFMFKPKLKIKN